MQINNRGLGRRAFRLVELLVVIVSMGVWSSCADTNGFIVPPFRGSANSQSGYWEEFTVAIGSPGNLADQQASTTDAVLTQTDPGAFVTGGNIYNPSTNSAFKIEDATPFVLGTVVLQARTLGNPLAYNSVSLVYSNASGAYALPPLFRYELSRAGGGVSLLWQWDLMGLNVSNYTIVFNGSGPHVSFDSMTLDTSAPIGTNFIDNAAFPQQPFNMQSRPATLSRWSYLVSDFSSANRQTASIFGALGNAPDFDARDAQYLLAWNTTNRIPAGQGAKNYLIRRARVTLTISGNSYVYTGALRDYRTYFPANNPNYLPSAATNFPVELFGTGFRGGFTNGANAFVPWAATNYPQTGPWSADPDFDPFSDDATFHANRVAFAAGFDTNGVLVDVSNNVGDDGTNEISNPFEIAPFAVGQTTNVLEGQVMPAHSQLTFDLNLDDPLIYGYLQKGLNEGTLSFMVASLVVGAQPPAPATYPAFYTIFSSIADDNEFPLLDIEGEIVRTNLDSDADNLSDDWENFYFGSLANDATNDVDGDGVGNLAEYQAGTIPTAGTNWLHSLSIQHENITSELHFTHAPGHEYSIQWSTDLQNWQTVTNPPLFYSSAWLAKTGTNLVYPSPVYAGWRDTGATNQQRFYRVGAH